MTTTVEREVESLHYNRVSEPTRRAQWWAGWRVALRLARRDVRRHRGRSALVLLMIGLPVMLLAFGATLAMTADRTARENAPYAYGTGVALVSGPSAATAVEQSADGTGVGWSDVSPAAAPIPGFTTDPTAAISKLVGGTAIPFGSPSLRATIDGARTSVQALAISLPPGADLGQRAHLISGRWAVSNDEVVVTRYGADLGLPTSGRLRLDEVGGSRTAGVQTSSADQGTSGRRVVGMAEAVTSVGSGLSILPAAVVVPLESTPSDWLVTDAKPIDWAAVQRLNRYALVVTSKAVTSLPPDELAQLDPQGFIGGQSQNLAVAVAAASGGLLITTTLLAGPAFAVSASRQRRTLALAAANGATVAQVRRFVLGQAVVLGSLAAVLGAALGLGAFFALRALHLRQLVDLSFFSPDVPWSLIGLVIAAALVSAVVAALIPARSLGRLDIVRVLRGQEVSQPLRHRLMVAGLVLCGIGAATALTRTVTDSGPSVAAFLIGSGLLAVGALCLVPALLVLSARAAGRLPLTMRMAARDSARQRARTAPTVAAVLAATALFSAACIGLASDTAKRADTYTPQVAVGTGIVRAGNGGDSRDQIAVADIIARSAPDVRVLRNAVLGNPYHWAPATTGPEASLSQRIVAVRQGCSAPQALADPFSSGYNVDCASLSTDGLGQGQVRVLPAAALDAVLQLDPAQSAVVAGGAIVLPDPATLPEDPRHGTLEMAPTTDVDVSHGTVTLAAQLGTRDSQRQEFTPTGSPTESRVPALLLPSSQFLRLQTNDGIGGALSAETVARRGWTSTPDYVTFYSPDGPIDSATQQRLQTAVDARFGVSNVEVERGFQRDDLPVVLVLIGVVSLLVLVATFVSTALSLAEQQPLMGTLAAVGATRGTRRRMAASQALHLAGLGALIGAAVGMVPGIAISQATAIGHFRDGVTVGPFVEIPWLQIAAPVVLVPLIAAAFAWLAVRRSPEVTRRLS